MNKSIKAKAFYSRKTATKELISLIQELENHLNWMIENDQTLETLEENIVDSFNNIQQIFDEKPDILCIGETKIDCNAFKDIDDSDTFSYFKYRYWSHCSTKKGYSGTAIFSKKKPLNVTQGLFNNTLDKEGRVITLEFKKYFLVHVYTPNSGVELKRLEWRTTV